MVASTEFKSGLPLFKIKHKRVWEIDALRGFCIILMLFDHAMFDFAMLDAWFSNFWRVKNKVYDFLFDFAAFNYWNTNWRITSRIIVISIFLFLSGISGVFSKNNLLRAFKLSAAAIALSSATFIIQDFGVEDIAIIFGILHCLAVSIFIYTLLKMALKDKAKYAFFGFGVALMLFSATYDFYDLPIVSGSINLKDFFDIVLGFKGYGGDYFGIIPYTGVFLLGAYAGETIYANRQSKLPRLDKKWNKPLCFVGRNTIWVYLLHQPIILGAIIFIGLLLGYKL